MDATQIGYILTWCNQPALLKDYASDLHISCALAVLAMITMGYALQPQRENVHTYR